MVAQTRIPTYRDFLDFLSDQNTLRNFRQPEKKAIKKIKTSVGVTVHWKCNVAYFLF